MTQAAFRLESFSRPLPPTKMLVDQQLVDAAFRRGLAEGRDLGASEGLHGLTDAIAALQTTLQDAAAMRADATRQAVMDLLPLLTEIVTTLAGTAESAGLEAALQAELQHLADAVQVQDWHIRCPADLEHMVRQAASAAGLSDPDIRIDPAACEASIILEDGRSAFSNEPVAQHFRDLIAELQESYR